MEDHRHGLGVDWRDQRVRIAGEEDVAIAVLARPPEIMLSRTCASSEADTSFRRGSQRWHPNGAAPATAQVGATLMNRKTCQSGTGKLDNWNGVKE